MFSFFEISFFPFPTSLTQAASFVELVLHEPSARRPKRSRGVRGGRHAPRLRLFGNLSPVLETSGRKLGLPHLETWKWTPGKLGALLPGKLESLLPGNLSPCSRGGGRARLLSQGSLASRSQNLTLTVVWRPGGAPSGGGNRGSKSGFYLQLQRINPKP